MKYNTISGSSLSAEGKKSTLTIYADLDIADKKKDPAMEGEVTRLKEELIQAQTALDRQTRRCRQLVGEFTRKLQEKESQYKYEKNLRDDQLSKVLRALLLVEARLKQEQKLLTDQLREKDFIIEKQKYDIKKLLSSQYCKSCSHLYNSSPNLESLDSSSEYIITEYQESNFGSLDSSSEQYTTMSEKDSSSIKSNNFEDSGSNEYKTPDLVGSTRFKKNKGKDSLEKRIKKISHRKSIGTYFEVLNLRNENASPYSNEDNTSNDYDNFDSLPPESVTDRMSVMSRDSENSYQFEQIEQADAVSNKEQESEGTNNVSLSDSNITVIPNKSQENCDPIIHNSVDNNQMDSVEDLSNNRENKLSDSISVFDVDGETNDKWYVSASDQEDEQQKNIYRNNPVLECVNQILLQNINDSLNSPPKTPNIERKLTKNKKVKFSDEEILISEDQTLTEKNLRENEINETHNYYETPIQKVPNFYETPQSIYSNDYEQILSRCGESTFFSSSAQEEIQKKNSSDQTKNVQIIRKNKILRAPPALPPKPDNLVSKYKIQNESTNLICDKSNDTMSLDSEPDYCSISELNLPVNKIISTKMVVAAEINPIPLKESIIMKEDLDLPIKKSESVQYDSVDNDEMIMKTIEKVNIQVAKQTNISSDDMNSSLLSPSKLCQVIPKLPQVSEIIIPEESDRENEETITQDNYIKNNTQILKTRNTSSSRRPINIGSSVSSLIMGFNNRELQFELNKKSPVKSSSPKKILPNFENPQNVSSNKQNISRIQMQTQEDFNLIQNFEEFKLDDCEIEEYIVNLPDSEKNEAPHLVEKEKSPEKNIEICTEVPIAKNSPEEVSIPNLNRRSLELLKQELQKQKTDTEQKRVNHRSNEPTYEHFLECTGLSSKSILTPSRLTTNHKTVMKPKDVKYRSKAKANLNSNSNSASNSIKYWSEPFI